MMMRIKGLLMKKKVVEELYDDFMYYIKTRKTWENQRVFLERKAGGELYDDFMYCIKYKKTWEKLWGFIMFL